MARSIASSRAFSRGFFFPLQRANRSTAPRIACVRQGYKSCWLVVSHEDRIAELPETGGPGKKIYSQLKG